MKITRLELENFRNIKDMTLSPGEGVNVIYGNNAQGKTNLLESICLFSGFKSFRESKDSDMISFGSDFIRNKLYFNGFGRDQKSEIIIGKEQKKILLNSVPLKSRSELIGNFNTVVFSPSYMSLIKGGPNERRKFLDSAICQIKPAFTSCLREYNKILKQRNQTLKDIYMAGTGEELLDIWDKKLIQKAEVIISERKKYLDKLSETAGDIHLGISSGKEELKLIYSQKGGNGFEDKDDFFLNDKLTKSRFADIKSGTTNFGPHRDDIDIIINSIEIKKFGSQGQQRSAALSMKLGESQIIYEMTGERPIALLDDVMSELDMSRQDFIMNHLDKWQVFITCCDPKTVLKLTGGKAFEIENGKIISEKIY